MLTPYRGLTPSNVSRDAKYSVVSGTTGDDEIRLIYHVSTRELYLLTTSQHSELVKMVNDAKVEISGKHRGIFYINEFGDVLVPDGFGGSYFVGNYEKNLEFTFDDTVISPKAAPGLEPGQTWPGPHVGVAYVLRAGGRDIRCELKEGNKRTRVYLSDTAGSQAASRLARRLAKFMGPGGGRFYINERCELFAPGRADDGVAPVYLGNLDEDPWFLPPDGYERP
jgi:hypothetical protein